MLNATTTLQNPNSATAAAASRNGASHVPLTGPLDKSVLSNLLASMKSQPATDPDPNGTSAQPAFAPVPEALNGEATETANATPDNEIDLSQSTSVEATTPDGVPGGEEPLPETEALDPDIQKHVVELAKLLKTGGLEIGEVKRIEKLLRTKGALESGNGELQAKVQAMEAQIAELKNGGAASAPEASNGNPFSGLKSEAELRQTKRKLHEIREWCEDYAEGGTFNGKELSADEVKSMRREISRALEFHLPERSEQLVQAQTVQAQQAQVLQTMKAQRPDLFNIENPVAQRVQFFAQHPRISNDPNRDMIAVFLALGEQAFKAKSAPAAVKPPARPAARPAAAVTSPGAAPRNGNAVKAAMELVAKDRSRESLVKFNAARRG